MLMVIFGAGASYDSLPTRPLDRFPNMDERLPLANDLFADRQRFADCLRQFPECLDIVPRLLGPFGNGSGPTSIEAALEDLQNEASVNARRYSQLAAIRFYIQKVIWDTNHRWNQVAQGMTNYRSLVDKIVHWNKDQQPVLFVTFNYDIMLEQALENFGLYINNFADYLSHKVFRVYKVHGSVNWARCVRQIGDEMPNFGNMDAPSTAKKLIERASDIKLSENFLLLKNYTLAKSGTVTIFPAIAIPVQTKTTYECPEEHLDLLKFFAPQVSKLLIVGWRGAEAHFRRLLRESLRERPVPKLIVDPDPTTVYKNLMGEQLLGTNAQFKGGFTKFIVENPTVADDFLRS